MGSGEAVIGYAQTNLFMDKYPKLDISFPKQGTPFWLDNYFFSKKAASNPDVYKFVNYTLQPNVAVQLLQRDQPERDPWRRPSRRSASSPRSGREQAATWCRG